MMITHTLPDLRIIILHSFDFMIYIRIVLLMKYKELYYFFSFSLNIISNLTNYEVSYCDFFPCKQE